MHAQHDDRGAVWTRYWAQGATHSCGGSFGQRYEGALAQFWRAAFASLDGGARVLDIATGNGALPQLLIEADPFGKLSCDAIDLATLAPAWLERLDPARRTQLRFYGGQVAESLPFAEGQFDLVMSQYGLEYTDLARSIPELLRVCAPAGMVRLVCHHAGSRPVLLALAELEHLTWISEPHGLLDAAALMIGLMARANSPAGRALLAVDAAANAARGRFNELQDQLSLLVEGSACPDILMEVRESLATVFELAMREGRAGGEAALGALRQQLADSELRLRELRDYALDADAVAALGQSLVVQGGKLEIDQVRERGALMGWSVSVTRAAS